MKTHLTRFPAPSLNGAPTTANGVMSKDHLYVTGASAPKAFETVLDVGCRGAVGLSPADTADVTANIWGQFTGLNTTNAAGKVLRYYGARKNTGAWYTTAALLQNQDGRCEAWARFLVDCLAAQGVSSNPVGVVLATPPAYYPNGTQNLTWTTAFLIKTSLPGQGNVKPLASFTNHEVVEIGTAIYDPSYGTLFNKPDSTLAENELAWQNYSVQYLYWVFSNNKSAQKPAKAYARKLVFTFK